MEASLAHSTECIPASKAGTLGDCGLRQVSGEETVRAESIEVNTHNLARIVYPDMRPPSGKPVVQISHRAGHVERGVAAILIQEATLPCRIIVISHDLARVVYPVGLGRVRARHVE